MLHYPGALRTGIFAFLAGAAPCCQKRNLGLPPLNPSNLLIDRGEEQTWSLHRYPIPGLLAPDLLLPRNPDELFGREIPFVIRAVYFDFDQFNLAPNQGQK